MHTHHNMFGEIPAEQMIIALQRLDHDDKESVMSIILTAAKRTHWIRDALQVAIAQQIEEQRDLDAWIEQEAALDAARHSDPYAMSKFGDAEFGAAQ